MTKKAKKVTLGIAALLAASLGVIGVGAMDSVANKVVNAAETTFTVDVLGNAKWTATADATGYEWSYTVNGEKSPTFTTYENGANIGIALTKAAQAAVALNTDEDTTNDVTKLDVSLHVAPIVNGVVGAAVSLEPATDITNYINYEYETHDITEYSTDAQGDGYEFGSAGGAYHSKPADYSATNNGRCYTPGAMWKNELLTFGLNRISYPNKAYYYTFALFGGSTSNSPAATTCNYHLMVYTAVNNGVIAKLSVEGEERRTWSNDELPLAVTKNNTKYAQSQEYGGTSTTATHYTYEIDNYFTVGVFDVFDLNGDKAGEHFFFDIDMKTSEGNIKDIATISEFFDTTITDELVYTGTTKGTDNKENTKGSTNFNIAAQYNKATLHSGKILEEMPITGVYYDNADATINWNAVAGADSYEYAIGNGEWTSVNANYVSVENRLSEYATGYMPVKVRAIIGGVAGEEVQYNAPMGYKARSTTKDIFEFSNYFNSLDYVYAGGVTTQATNNTKKLTVGDHATFAFTADGSLDRTFALFCTNGLGSGAPTDGCYSVTFWEDGVVTFGMDTFYSYGAGNDWIVARDIARCWQTFDGVLETGTKYFVDFGVDNVYDESGVDIIAERVSLRIAVADGNGGFKTVLVTSYDNTQCGEEDAFYVDKTDGKFMMSRSCNFGSTISYDLNKYSITLDGKIGTNAYMNISALSRTTVAKMQMQKSYGDKTTDEETGKTTYATTEEPTSLPTAVGDLYKFTHYVAAKDIDEEFALELVIGGKKSGVVYTFKARDYIDEVQENSEQYEAEYPGLVDLVTALEDYCDYAAAYYNDTTLDPNNALNEVDEAMAFKPLVVSDLTDKAVQAVGMSLLTEEDTTIRLYIQATDTLTVKVGDQTLEVKEKNGYFYADLADISGFDLATEYTFTINGEVRVTCSALSYGALVVENMSENTELVNVVKALYNYSKAATAYKGE